MTQPLTLRVTLTLPADNFTKLIQAGRSLSVEIEHAVTCTPNKKDLFVPPKKSTENPEIKVAETSLVTEPETPKPKRNKNEAYNFSEGGYPTEDTKPEPVVEEKPKRGHNKPTPELCMAVLSFAKLNPDARPAKVTEAMACPHSEATIRRIMKGRVYYDPIARRVVNKDKEIQKANRIKEKVQLSVSERIAPKVKPPWTGI